MLDYIVLGSLFILILFLTVYYRTWRHPAGFASGPSLDGPKGPSLDGPKGPLDPTPNPTKVEKDAAAKVMMEEQTEPPFVIQPIQSVDDYEYNLVFYNEGDKAITKAQRDLLMSQYPMDWSVQPPSSSIFQRGAESQATKERFENQMPIPKANPYKEVDGSSMTPPDTLTAEMTERDILATYTPKKPGELTTYDAADAKALIEKIYDAKGMVADYKEVKPNVFAVVGTRKKDEKVVYEEEEAPVAQGAVPSAGEKVLSAGVESPMSSADIVVPPVASEVAAGLDPFFTAGEKTRDGKWDYTRWTPGLERMFAPNEARTNWY